MRMRRDPRAERQARLIPGGERPRFGFAPSAPPSIRPRWNPRALRHAATVIVGERPRIDWQAGRTGAAAASSRADAAGRTAPQPQIRIVADPAFLVLAVPDHSGGALSEHDRELIGAARYFADAGGGAVVALAFNASTPDHHPCHPRVAASGEPALGDESSAWTAAEPPPSPLPVAQDKPSLSPCLVARDKPSLQRHPRESGDPVNAGVSAVLEPCHSRSLVTHGEATAYWVPAFAGMTAEGVTDALAAAGADRAMLLAAGRPGEYDPETRAAAVLAAIDTLKPRHVLFPESAHGGGDLARRVAALMYRSERGLQPEFGKIDTEQGASAITHEPPECVRALAGERLFPGVEVVSASGVSRRMRGGGMEMTARPPLLMSIAEGAWSAHDGPRHEARLLEAPEFSAPRKIEKAAPLPVDAASIALADADFILSGGNGVTAWETFKELGQTLGATLGGSRVVCDEGHLPRDRQVGASGSVVTARCYLAFGIAGAPQHLQGIAEVQHVVAVNTDLHAEMIKRADLAIIADAQDVMPALIGYAEGWRASSADIMRAGHGADLPSPMGRGQREAPGEGMRPINVAPPHLTEKSYPLTSALSRGKRLSFSALSLRESRLSVRAHDGEREPEAALDGSSAAVKVAVLLSVGRHPASGRARRAPLDARALEMALGLPGAEVHAVHAGDPAQPALRDYLGMGLARLSVLAIPQGGDPVPALAAHLGQLAPDVVLCGGHAEGGEDSGMLPYLIAEALGFAMVADVAAIDIGAGKASLTQALPRGKRRLVETRSPVVAAVSAAAPAPRQSAFARARRGVIDIVAAEPPADTFLAGAEIRPWRPRPKRMRLAAAASAADRLKAMTETKSGEGAVMINPSPDDAARAIYAYLLEKRIIENRP